MARLFQRFNDDGSITTLKYLLKYIVIFTIVGWIMGTIKVVLFEQTPSGRFAIHEECVQWDESCVQYCEDENPWGGGGQCDCCLKTSTKVTTLGDRIKEESKMWSIMGGALSIVFGLYAAEKHQKNKAV